MAYDPTLPLDNGYLAEAPAELREQFRALIEDKIVNAGALNGYIQGNASGNIPLNNGTLNANLNADMLDGKDSAAFAAAGHVHSVATANADGFMSKTDKTKLNGIATGAEVNQNAFSNITVGRSTIQADGKTDTLTLAAGTGITLTPDTTNDKVTIAVQNNTYAAASHTHQYVPLSGGTMTGNLVVPGIKSGGDPSIASASSTYLKFKMASTSNAPSNGIVLEYSGVQGWVGQLYLGDNATRGLYWNGWSNGTRGEWKKFAFIDSNISGTAANATKWANKTLRLNHNTTDTWIPVFSDDNVDYVYKSEIASAYASAASVANDSGYVKFANGLQICYARLYGTSTYYTWTFPRAFAAVPSIALITESATDITDIVPRITNFSATKVDLKRANSYARVIAIGKGA